MRPSSNVVSIDALKSVYLDKTIPVSQVASRLGISSTTAVYYYVKKFGLTRRIPESIVRKMAEAEKAWLACAVDGEGTIGLNKNRKNWTSPIVEISNTDRRFIERCCSISGVGEPRLKMRASAKHSECWQWRIRRRSSVSGILIQIQPYLVIKDEQARTVLQFLSDPDHPDALVSQIHEANRKGPK